MAKMIGKNINANSEANSATISVGSTTAVTLLAAQSVGDLIWSVVIMTNDGNQALWVRLRSAASDNLKTDIRISPGTSERVIQNSENYTGEISGIFEFGGARDVHIVYF